MGEGLLRWREVLSTLQEAVALGLFGERLRLRQMPDGAWQLLESPEAQTSALTHDLTGAILTPNLDLVGGVGVLVDGRLSTEDPPPTITLPDAQLTGPTTMVVTTTRVNPDSDYATPAVLQLVDGLPSGGAVLDYFEPVGLIIGGRVLTLARG